MGIDYLIIVLSLVTFLGFLSVSFIYFPCKETWQTLYQFYKKVKNKFPLTDSKKARSEPSLRNTGLKDLRLMQPSIKKTKSPTRKTDTDQYIPSTITILYLMAPSDCTYNGYTLWQTLIDHNLIYGDSKIFHAYGEEKNTILFSIAGAIEPGYFEIDDIASIRLPGLCLFMQNEATPHPLETFEYMLEIAKKLANQLGGTVCDDKRHPLSEKAITVYQSKLSAL